jgi:hypothetical protein
MKYTLRFKGEFELLEPGLEDLTFKEALARHRESKEMERPDLDSVDEPRMIEFLRQHFADDIEKNILYRFNKLKQVLREGKHLDEEEGLSFIDHWALGLREGYRFVDDPKMLGGKRYTEVDRLQDPKGEKLEPHIEFVISGEHILVRVTAVLLCVEEGKVLDRINCGRKLGSSKSFFENYTFKAFKTWKT